MQRPNHKPAADKFKDTGVRTFAPLTMEDKGQFGNLGLIKSLRADRDRNNAHNMSRTSKANDPDKLDADADDQEDNKQQNQAAYAEPPSFCDAYTQKWREKFTNSIKQRQEYKKQQLKDDKVSIFTGNVAPTEKQCDEKLEQITYTGG